MRLREAVQDSLKRLREQHAAALDALVTTLIDAALAERDAEVAEARAQVEAAAQQTLDQNLSKVRAEADAQLAETRAAIAADAQQKIERAMAEADANLADALKSSSDEAANARAEAKMAREGAAEAHAAAENARNEAAAARLEKEKAREEAAQARFELAKVRDELTSSRAEAQKTANALSDAHRSEREADLAGASRLLDAIKTLDDSHSLTDVFDTLARQAGREAARTAVLLVKGEQIHGWRFVGFDGPIPDPKAVQLSVNGPGVVAEAVRSGLPRVVTPQSGGLDFAPLPTDRAGLAVPLQVGGRIVAVLYADDAAPGRTPVPSAWPEVVEILVRHAARCLEGITARHSGVEQQTQSTGKTAEPGGMRQVL